MLNPPPACLFQDRRYLDVLQPVDRVKFVAVPMVFFCRGLDDFRASLMLFILPCIAVACVTFAYRALPEASRQPRTFAKFAFPWKPILLLCLKRHRITDQA